ncbi:MAG: glutathione S-transferase C-terminal domain-containing protein, partial [Arenicellales bacterium]
RAEDALEEVVGDWGDELTLGQISAGAALGYVDFRLPDMDWRSSHPRLAKWYAGFSQRPSMKQTVPVEPR